MIRLFCSYLFYGTGLGRSRRSYIFTIQSICFAHYLGSGRCCGSILAVVPFSLLKKHHAASRMRAAWVQSAQRQAESEATSKFVRKLTSRSGKDQLVFKQPPVVQLPFSGLSMVPRTSLTGRDVCNRPTLAFQLLGLLRLFLAHLPLSLPPSWRDESKLQADSLLTTSASVVTSLPDGILLFDLRKSTFLFPHMFRFLRALSNFCLAFASSWVRFDKPA